eukprot:SAG22_NODE_532_length_9401_cov_29.999892_6_plen_337_part_00
MLKTFLVQALPSFLPLGFVAFGMPSPALQSLARVPADHGGCVAGAVETEAGLPSRPPCVDELAALLPLFLTAHALVWLLENGLALWWGRRRRAKQQPNANRRRRAGGGTERWAALLPVEAEAAKPKADSLAFTGYSNLALQFGWVAMFGAVWPLAAVVAAASVLLQVRLHAKSMCVLYQRPAPQGCRGIGPWRWVFVVLGLLAVASNCGLVFFTSNLIGVETLAGVGRVAAFILAEHAGWGLLALGFVVGAVVPAASAEALHARRHQLKLYLAKLRRLRSEAAWQRVKKAAMPRSSEEDGREDSAQYPFVETEQELWAQLPQPGKAADGGEAEARP